MEIAGFVKKVDADETQVSPTYSKRELVVTTEEQYPQHILIEFAQGKCNKELDMLAPGQRVTVSINIGGREWVNPQGETKYFNSIKGWRVAINTTPGTAAARQAPAQQPETTQQTSTQFPPASNFNEEEHDDLPF